jgi:hypothetical protein
MILGDTRPNELAENRFCLSHPTSSQDKWRLIAGNPPPGLLPRAAETVGLVPFEIPDSRDIVDPQMSHQPVTQTTGAHTSNIQNVLVLITQDVDAVDWRHAVQIIGVPSLRLLDSRDHNSYPYGLLDIAAVASHDRNA